MRPQVFRGKRAKIDADVASADTYRLYERAGIWYVDFNSEGRRKRRSTGQKNEIDARAALAEIRPLQSTVENAPNDEFLRRALERARYRAHKKGIPFGLSMAHLRSLYQKAGGACSVSGHKLESTGPFRPSLDRVEPSLGYVDGNVRIVCLIANTAMLHYGENALLELAASVAKNRRLLIATVPSGIGTLIATATRKG